MPIACARAIEALRLEPLRRREQRHDHRRLFELADRDRADDGDDHQHVDVERAALDRLPRALRRETPAPTMAAAMKIGALHSGNGVNQPMPHADHDQRRRDAGEPAANARAGRRRLVSSQCAQPMCVVRVATCRLAAYRAVRPSVAGSCRERRTCFLDVLQRLPEERHDVLIVERVEDDAAVAARADQPHAAQQAQLVRHRRLAQAAAPRPRSQTHSSPCESASRMRTRVGSPRALKVSASPAPRRAATSARADLPHPGEVDLDEVADVVIFEHMSRLFIC